MLFVPTKIFLFHKSIRERKSSGSSEVEVMVEEKGEDKKDGAEELRDEEVHGRR